MKPNGTDEPTPAAPAKADEAQPAAPAKGSGELDWQGYLAKAEEQFSAEPPPPDGEHETDPPAKRHLPTEAPLTEDDGFTVTQTDEVELEEQPGPTDGAGATEEEPAEFEEEVLTSPDELAIRLREKEQSEANLIALKGRLGKKIGDLVKTLRLNGLDENGQPLKSEMSEEERQARQSKAVAELTEDPEGWFDRRLADRLGQAAVELDEIQSRTALQDAQNGGFRSFQTRYKIGDPVEWAKGREGQSWRRELEKSPRDKAAFERFMETGNKEGISLVLADVYDRVIAQRKGADAQGRREVQQARVQKRKAPVLPGSPRPRAPQRPGVDISKPANWMKVVEIAKRQGY